MLAEEGFSIKKGLANMEHCFVATYGSGKTMIGILAEYDALGNLSQVADLAEPKPEVQGGNSHGCGHNLLGTGALDAVELMNIGVQFLREHIIDEGRVHYTFMDAGGESANVVQLLTSLYYFIWAPKIEQAHEIYQRVNKLRKEQP